MKVFVAPFTRRLVACSFCFSLVVRAGSFSSDFNSGLPPGANVFGNALVDSIGGVGDSGVLKLTTATGNQTGSFIIEDLDPGLRVWSFLATFKVRMGGGTATPADGFSFNFATDLPNTFFNEEGAGSGLTITFDAYDNGTGDTPEGPEIRIKSGGALIASRKLSSQLKTGTNFVDVSVAYTSSGTITLVYNGTTFFTNLFVFGPPGPGARFGFGARTGGAYQDHFIDDVNITTTTINRFYIKGNVIPSQPFNVSPDTAVQIVLNDFGNVSDTNSFSMLFNGAPASISVSKVGAVTTVFYDPPGGLLSNSLNQVSLTFADDSGQPPATLQYDFTITAATLWNLAPTSRIYLPVDTDASGGTTPLYRSVAYNSYSNQLYVVSRTSTTAGLTVNVLDASSGADLYQLNTTGISGGSIILLSVVAAEDGSIYAANMVNPYSAANPFKIYRWTNSASTTTPQVVFTGNPNSATTTRWGDTLTVRSSGIDTWLLTDSGNASVTAVIYPSDSELTNFIAYAMSHSYNGTTIGRSLQWLAADKTWCLKKKAAGPQPLITYHYESGNAVLQSSIAPFHAQVGPVGFDNSRNLAAGIFFTTNTLAGSAPDRLIVYDVSSLSNVFQLAQYNFPTTHQKNNNFIGQVVFGGDRIFAVDGNNGIICVPAIPPGIPRLEMRPTVGALTLSWTNTVPFVAQSTPTLSPPAWTNLTLPVTVVSNRNSISITDSIGGGNKFYRLQKP